MDPTNPPVEKKPLKNCSLAEFLDVLASDAMMPGCGTASGVALAMATACAGKAVAITRHHKESSTLLANLQKQLAELTESALVLAEDDARQFKRQLSSDDPATANALLQTDRSLLDICGSLDQLLNENAPHIAENMTGDWHAARALNNACRIIQENNLRELTDDS